MNGQGDPREVLAAVRRMESELARVRAGAARPVDDLVALRDELAAESARERRAVVEDLEILLDVMEAGWRRTHEELARVSRQVAELREAVLDCQDSVANARLEVHLGTSPPRNGGRPY